MHFQPQGCKFNDFYSQNDSIVKFYSYDSRKRYNFYSKNDNGTYEGASSITENALTMGVFVYSKNDSSDFEIVSIWLRNMVWEVENFSIREIFSYSIDFCKKEFHG